MMFHGGILEYTILSNNLCNTVLMGGGCHPLWADEETEPLWSGCLWPLLSLQILGRAPLVDGFVCLKAPNWSGAHARVCGSST